MNWKNFLKLDWRKIVLTIILLFLIPSMGVSCPGPSTRKIMAGGTCIFAVSWQGNTLAEFYEFPQKYYYDGIVFPALLSLVVVVNYLIASLIVTNYDKFKTKKLNAAV